MARVNRGGTWVRAGVLVIIAVALVSWRLSRFDYEVPTPTGDPIGSLAPVSPASPQISAGTSVAPDDAAGAALAACGHLDDVRTGSETPTAAAAALRPLLHRAFPDEDLRSLVGATLGDACPGDRQAAREVAALLPRG